MATRSLDEGTRLLDDNDHDASGGHSSSSSNNKEFDHSDKSRSTGYLLLLTITIGGLQLFWNVQMSSVSPFLLSLGLSKALMALVWLAGPISGSLVQPFVGLKSDACRSRFGRRRPFMVAGGAGTMVSLVALAWTKETVDGIAELFGRDSQSHSTCVARQVYATAFVFILDFAINVVQAAIRCFIVDCAPAHQQETANAWANRITHLFNIFGYLAGTVDLPSLLPFLGHSNFQALATMACVVFTLTLTVSCLGVRERDASTLPPPDPHSGSLLLFFRNLYRAARRLPPQVKRVCQVQLFAWAGWFPFLFYTSTYIAGLYAEPFFRANPDLADADIDEIMQQGTLEGSFALLVFAVTSFLSSVLLPLFVVPAYADTDALSQLLDPAAEPPTPSGPSVAPPESPTGLPPGEDGSRSRSRASTLWKQTRSTLNLRILRVPGLTLRRAWMLSLVMCFAVLASTAFVTSHHAATLLVGLVGVPWAMTTWAPFALISTEIAERRAAHELLARRRRRQHRHHAQEAAIAVVDAQEEPSAGPSVSHADPKATDALLATDLETQTQDQEEEGAGAVIGVHNVAIAAPQMASSLASSLVFAALQKPRGQPGDSSVGWVLRLGGLCMLGAAWAAGRVGEPGELGRRRRQQAAVVDEANDI